MKIILSTRNPSKAEQIKAIFAGSSFSILTLEEAGFEGEAIEDGDTLEANALKKAIFAHRPGTWSMADDSGIFIDALGGAPGVRSARWAGETATTDEITAYTLKRLEDVMDRSASFMTKVALISPTAEVLVFNGEVRGKLLEAPRTRPQPKMPYSPIFVPDGHDLTWAEMSVELENNISHRGKAFRKAKEFLESR